jgi:hypothetical protein
MKLSCAHTRHSLQTPVQMGLAQSALAAACGSHRSLVCCSIRSFIHSSGAELSTAAQEGGIAPDRRCVGGHDYLNGSNGWPPQHSLQGSLRALEAQGNCLDGLTGR